MLVALFFISIFIIGLAFGSFLNCLMYRLAHNKSIWGRSHCPNCKKQIIWYDNIPIISFIFLKKQCRQCHEKISWQYPIVELITGLMFLLVVWRLNAQIAVISYQLDVPSTSQYIGFIFTVIRDWIIFFTLLFIFVYDFKYLKIEDIVLLPAAGIIFILTAINPQITGSLDSAIILERIRQMALAMLIPVLFFAAQYFLTKKRGIGLGDLRIGIFMGAALGFWQKILVALFFSYIIGAVFSLFLILFKYKKLKSQIPLGPFLAIGTTIAFFYSQQIINFYIQ